MVGSEMNRRAMIGSSLSVVAAVSMPFPAHARPAGSTVVAATRYGKVRGKREDGIAKFLGVPYATPPLGELRFKAPKPPTRWSGVRDTVSFPNPAFQVPGNEMGPGGNGRMPAPSEDCLYLNIWTPAADCRRRPVMFYNHGGGYMIGSGSGTGQDGSRLARLYDVVVVESNHRLGLLGYLFLGDLADGDYAANQGMLDVLAALRWTRENIENFGGDPDNIMVWGESGGGAKTAAVYTMPAAAPLFHKASIESAAPLRFPTRDGATARARRTLELLGLTTTDLPRLHDIPAARLLEIQQSEAANGAPPWGDPGTLPGFGAFVDGTVIPRHPFADGAAPFSAGKPLMCGTCRDETVFFSLFGPRDIFSIDEAGLRARLSSTYQGAELDRIIRTFQASRPGATPAQLYFAITTSPIWRDSIKIAEAKRAQHAAPVFMYQLAYPSPTLVPGTDFPIGSPHASDINLKFANTDKNLDYILNADQSPERLATARHMSELWAGFAHTGRPTAAGVPRWPAYTLTDRATMWLDARCRIVTDPDRTERLFWENRDRVVA
ncbi:carboxylesterase/lipase family protein [Streptomyces europaeiscabiei]|uniref:carboxylesterase/lipase family protein n=1 Tax=Streptomyces europaeiscabiei TaxID=146819 RepID=UPI000E6A7086|nr:carboxylesterase family protein [Streptomyces europaeiscabiei]MDX2524704.1 carboxylesterase family protein [Streptomyces europaeiscabiei]MDX2769274.1 carboxylesterase family protein [Streptomyces europaeiscabiei]MDX3848772.1 carboxylesterase family protein [Streptomyces europaeiscabiei]